eukprot:362094-Chlamydomonas_euryale.AAC.4
MERHGTRRAVLYHGVASCTVAWRGIAWHGMVRHERVCTSTASGAGGAAAHLARQGCTGAGKHKVARAQERPHGWQRQSPHTTVAGVEDCVGGRDLRAWPGFACWGTSCSHASIWHARRASARRWMSAGSVFAAPATARTPTHLVLPHRRARCAEHKVPCVGSRPGMRRRWQHIFALNRMAASGCPSSLPGLKGSLPGLKGSLPGLKGSFPGLKGSLPGLKGSGYYPTSTAKTQTRKAFRCSPRPPHRSCPHQDQEEGPGVEGGPGREGARRRGKALFVLPVQDVQHAH